MYVISQDKLVLFGYTMWSIWRNRNRACLEWSSFMPSALLIMIGKHIAEIDLKRKIMGWQELWQASVVKDSILMRKYFGDASLVSGGDENDGAGVAQSGGSSQASDDMAGSPPGNLHGLSDFVDNMLHDFTESDNDSSDNTSYGSMFLF